jgi:hypothetical protein
MPGLWNGFRVIALIDHKEAIQRILRHLGLRSSSDATGARSPAQDWVHEPWLEDPMPEYENLLTN